MGLFGTKTLYDVLSQDLKSLNSSLFEGDIDQTTYERMHREVMERIDRILEQDKEIAADLPCKS